MIDLMVTRVPLAGLMLLAVVTLGGCKHDNAKAGADSPDTTVRLHPKDGDLASQLNAEATKAEARHLKAYAELRADWCEPCKALEASRSDPLMIDAFAGTYVIAIDADEWAGKLTAAGLASSAIPVFFALDAHGKPTGRKIDGGAWGDNVPKNMAPPLKAFFQSRSGS